LLAGFRKVLGSFATLVDMSHGVTRSVLFVILAISVGFALGAVTKFGLGYDLAADPSQPKALAAQ
jgi:hypothetical protein